MKTKWQKIKDEILNSPKWLVSLDKSDIGTITGGDDCNIIVLNAATECSTEDRFDVLMADIYRQYQAMDLKGNKIMKVLLFVQFPISFPVMIAEMNTINELVDGIIGDNNDCEIKWGLSPREDSVSRIVCAFNLL